MIKMIVAIDKRSVFLRSSNLLVLWQIRPDGIAAPSGGGLSVLDGMLGTFVDAAQALEALGCPCRLSFPERNGGRRAVSDALTTSVATVLGKETLCAAGKFVEPEVGKMGLHPRKRPLMDSL